MALTWAFFGGGTRNTLTTGLALRSLMNHAQRTNHHWLRCALSSDGGNTVWGLTNLNGMLNDNLELSYGSMLRLLLSLTGSLEKTLTERLTQFSELVAFHVVSFLGLVLRNGQVQIHTGSRRNFVIELAELLKRCESKHVQKAVLGESILGGSIIARFKFMFPCRQILSTFRSLANAWTLLTESNSMKCTLRW